MEFPQVGVFRTVPSEQVSSPEGDERMRSAVLTCNRVSSVERMVIITVIIYSVKWTFSLELYKT